MLLKFIKLYWKSIFIFCLIFYVSTMRIPKIPCSLIFPQEDKLVHIIMYFTLSSVIYFDIFRAQIQINRFFLLLIILAFPIVYGGIIEILQGAFFAPRTASWLDFFADAVGSILAFFLTPILLRKTKLL